MKSAKEVEAQFEPRAIEFKREGKAISLVGGWPRRSRATKEFLEIVREGGGNQVFFEDGVLVFQLENAYARYHVSKADKNGISLLTWLVGWVKKPGQGRKSPDEFFDGPFLTKGEEFENEPALD